MLGHEGQFGPGPWVVSGRSIHSCQWGIIAPLRCPFELFEVVLGHLVGMPVIGGDKAQGHIGRQPQGRGP